MENGSVQSVTLAVAGRSALYHINGMAFPVLIADVRKVWGRVDVLIAPVGGDGAKWVEQSSITLK